MGKKELTTLFVYGTLRKGLDFHYALSNEVFMGYAQTITPYQLHMEGRALYPALVPDVISDTRICGEVYLVRPIVYAAVEKIEGSPILFKAAPIEVDVLSVGGPSRVTAVTFFWAGDAEELFPVPFFDYLDVLKFIAGRKQQAKARKKSH